MSSRKRIVICGGGAIGAAIAYFTSRRGARPMVIERHEVAGAASGKSGGFLALDWCRGSPLDRLARRSFELHAELSSELGDTWGYRRLTTYAGYAAEDRGADGLRIRLGRQPARRPHVRLDLCDPGSQVVDERRWLVFVELDGDSAAVE